MPNYDYNYFEEIYKNTLQKGETFSSEMKEEIKSQLEKTIKDYQKWLNTNENCIPVDPE